MVFEMVFLMSPGCQRFTLRAWLRTISIIDSTGLAAINVASSVPRTPRRVTVNISARPLPEAPGGVGVDLLQLAGQVAQVPLALGGIGVLPGGGGRTYGFGG